MIDRMKAWVARKLSEFIGVDKLQEALKDTRGQLATADGVARRANALCRVAMEEMKELREKIATAERTYLDIPSSSKSSTTIVVASQLGGGYVRVFNIHFGNLSELRHFMDSRFPGWQDPRRGVVDAGPDVKRSLYDPR